MQSIKHCPQCGSTFDASLSSPGNEARRKFCSVKCKTDWHNRKFYGLHSEEVKQAVTARRRGRPTKSATVADQKLHVRATGAQVAAYKAAAKKANKNLSQWILGCCDNTL